MTASSAPTSTVSSSWTLISRSFPATGEGISVSTLSVETSSSGSSTATSSPTCLSQRVTVPSVTDSPSAGRVTDVPEPSPDVPACEASASGFVSAELGAVSCALGAESVRAAGGSVSVSVLRSSPASAVVVEPVLAPDSAPASGSTSARSPLSSDPLDSPSSPMVHSSAPTSTVSSSSALISSSVPATGEGISVSTLSVDTSSRGSSTATWSPGCLSQRVTVPSVTDSPSAGRVTEVAMRSFAPSVRSGVSL